MGLRSFHKIDFPENGNRQFTLRILLKNYVFYLNNDGNVLHISLINELKYTKTS